MKLFLSLLIFLTSVCVFAQQYDWQVKNSMKTNMEQLLQYCPLDNVPDDLGRCKSVSKNIRKAVDNVETQNRKIAEFLKVAEYLEKAEKKIPEWENKEKSDAEAKKEAAKLSEEFKTKVKEHGILGSVWGMKNDPKKYIEKNAEILLKDVARAKAAETEFFEACKSKKYDNVSTFSNETDYGHPKSVCDMAQNWKTYFKSYVERVLNSVLTETKERISTHLKNLEEKGELFEYDIPRLEKPSDVVDKFVKEYSVLAKEFDIELTADYFKEIIELAKPYSVILKKASSVNRWDKKATFQDKNVSAVFKKSLTDNGLSVIKVGLTHNDWTIYKNDLGIPLYKVRSGFVLAKTKSETFCRLYYITARSEYEGGKKGYTLPSFSFDKTHEGYLVSTCK